LAQVLPFVAELGLGLAVGVRPAARVV